MLCCHVFDLYECHYVQLSLVLAKGKDMNRFRVLVLNSAIVRHTDPKISANGHFSLETYSNEKSEVTSTTKNVNKGQTPTV